MTILYTDPHIFTISNFLSDDECDHFIKKADNITFNRSLVSDDKQGMYSNGRTSSTVWLKHNTDEITFDVGNRISNIVNIPLENAENYQVIKYELNLKIWHYDKLISYILSKTSLKLINISSYILNLLS